MKTQTFQSLVLILGAVLLGIALFLVKQVYFPSTLTPVTQTPETTETDLEKILTSPDQPPQNTPRTVIVPVPPAEEESSSESVRKKDLVIGAETITPGEDSTDPHLIKGKSYMKLFQFNEALQHFQQADSSQTVTQYYLGILAAFQGRRSDAEAFFQNVMTLGHDARATANSERYLKAYAVFDTFKDGTSEFLDTLLSKEFLAAGELEVAIDKLKFVTRQHPSYSDAWILLGSAYMVYGNFEKAIASLSNTLPSRKSEVYYWLGLAYHYQENPRKALAAFQQALNKGYEPRAKLEEKLGDVYLEFQDMDSAQDHYLNALKFSQPPTIDQYIRPVWLYIDFLKSPQEAQALASLAVNAFPDTAMAHNLLGWSFLAAEQYEKAEISLLEAKRLNSALPAVYLNLGNLYRAQNRESTAIASYEEAVKLDPTGAVGKRASEELKKIAESG